MRLRLLLLAILATWLLPGLSTAAVVPREILVIHYDPENLDSRFTDVHMYMEAVLNHLGLTLRYHNLQDGLPNSRLGEDVRGLLFFFNIDELSAPLELIGWTEQQARSRRGLRLVLMGQWAFQQDTRGREVDLRDQNRFLSLFGLATDGSWHRFTYDDEFVAVRGIMGFERPVPEPLPPYPVAYAEGPSLEVLLGARPKGESHEPHRVLASLHDRGGYIAWEYGLYRESLNNRIAWIVNPFEFFRRAFATDELPKPDTTTLCGRRIYYSHIDGDGWLNRSEVDRAGRRSKLAPRVILERVIKAHPDLPVTVAPVAADLHPDWHGTEEARDVAREIFSLPQVEPATHTLSHPFAWSFYREFTPQKEEPFRKRYLSLSGRLSRIKRLLAGKPLVDLYDTPKVDEYELPRAFLEHPFDLAAEITDSAAYIESLAPPGKKVQLLQWSGDTTPFEEAIALADEAGLFNINGGDTRLDAEFPSVAYVAPVGRRVGDRIQVYSSNSNENTYTELWTDRFFGYRLLANTVKNTETPVRLKPFNVYYHMYSGEKHASLNALLFNLDLARKSELVPVETSLFAAIGRGFFTTEIEQQGTRAWRIRNRGRLATIRFDRATFLGVDFKRSQGVLGQRHYQGSLYVALDPAEQQPVISLKHLSRADRDPEAQQPYLVESRWLVSSFAVGKDKSFAATVRGYGEGSMTWHVPWPGTYQVRLLDPDHGREIYTADVPARDGRLILDLPVSALAPLHLTVRRQEAGS